jgi:hypothetical protein
MSMTFASSTALLYTEKQEHYFILRIVIRYPIPHLCLHYSLRGSCVFSGQHHLVMDMWYILVVHQYLSQCSADGSELVFELARMCRPYLLYMREHQCPFTGCPPLALLWRRRVEVCHSLQGTAGLQPRMILSAPRSVRQFNRNIAWESTGLAPVCR